MIQTESIGAKSARFRWRRVFLLFALILAGIFAAAWFWEPWYFAHEFSRDPHLAIVPQPLRITNQSKLYPVRLQAFEYSFQTPWEQAQKRKDFRTAGIIWFKGGPTCHDIRSRVDIQRSHWDPNRSEYYQAAFRRTRHEFLLQLARGGTGREPQ